MKKRIINVANRLPITIDKTIRKSSGGLVSALEGVKDRFDFHWVGWPGTTIKNPDQAQKIEKTLENEYQCTPVFLTRQEITNYYYGFSNSSLWPLLHYMSQYVRHDEQWWQEYQNVNRRFADFTLSHAQPGDLIWVHDYHLMLMPAMLREKGRDLKIGFFLHTPFPSYEIFRCHPHRSELLEGLLGADLIGFHTYGYMRHFKSSVIRLLGIDTGMDRVTIENRDCRMGVYPIGINSKAFAAELESERFVKKKEELASIYQYKKIVLGVERVDYSKGIPRRLEAIDRFLEKWPDTNHIVFIFVGVPSRGEVEEYQMLVEKIEGMVGKINGKHATVENVPIHFIHKSVDFTELCALYSLADVAMVTPLIDGMNLVAKEYVACKKDAKGVLMLSEFAGAAEELFKAITVNPYDVDQMADRLKQALTVPEEEKIDRMQGIYERVMEYDAEYWAKSFVTELEKISSEQTEHVITSDSSITDTYDKFKSAQKVAFFLDYDGTLREFDPDPSATKPTPEIIELIRRIEGLCHIDGFVVSGRTMDILGDWLGDYSLALISEHGYRYKPAGSDSVRLLHDRADLSWKQKVREVLEHFARSTPGSHVEEKISAVVWHYRRSDPEFGLFKAQQLISSLYEMLANLPVEVHHGKKIVEVTSMQVSKGAAMEYFLSQEDYDLVLCAGDDQTDESMFGLLDERIVSIKVGEGDTQAKYRAKDPADFRRLLNQILDLYPLGQ